MKTHLRPSRRSRFLGLAGPASSAAILAASLAAFCQAAMAQTMPGGAAENALSEIIVTAQKREERLQDVPISIAVLDGKVLDSQATGGTLEALALVPGISQSMSDAGGMTQVSIRGVSPAVTFGDGSSTVGYYLDSIPFGLVRSAAVPNTNDFDLSRIEVLRGPQGTLYGASALNGVVHIITNDADPAQFEAKVRVGGASTDGGGPSGRIDAEVNIPVIQDKLAVRIVGGEDYEGGWIDQPKIGKRDANTTDTQNLRVKVDIRPTENLKVDLAGWHSSERDAAASYADSSGNQPFTYQSSPSTTTYDAYNAKIAYELPLVSISSATSYIKFNQTIHSDFDYVNPSPPGNLPLYTLYSNLPASVLAEEFLLNSKGDGPWRWSAGAFYRDAHDDRYQTLGFLLGPEGAISWRDSSKSTAVFGQITRTFDDDHFELSAGLRYFHDDAGTLTLEPSNSVLPPGDATAQFHAVTPRFVASWLPNQHLTVYASYSEGFRSGLEQTPLTLLASPNLPPAGADHLRNFEVGAKGDLWDRLVTYDASVYYIEWTNVQQAGDILYNGIYVSGTINGTSASGAGTDLSVVLHPAKGLRIGFDLSENDLTNDESVIQPGAGTLYGKGERLAFSPKYTADAFVDYAHPLNDKLDARLNVSGNYRSAEILNVAGGGAQLSGGVTCFQGNSCYTSGSPMLINANFDISNHSNQTLSIYVQNLNNWNGLLIPSPEVTTPYRTRPRTIGIQFEARY